jgi:hypothetical protein
VILIIIAFIPTAGYFNLVPKGSHKNNFTFSQEQLSNSKGGAMCIVSVQFASFARWKPLSPLDSALCSRSHGSSVRPRSWPEYKTPMKSLGKVVWADRDGFGVKFLLNQVGSEKSLYGNKL